MNGQGVLLIQPRIAAQYCATKPGAGANSCPHLQSTFWHVPVEPSFRSQWKFTSSGYRSLQSGLGGSAAEVPIRITHL